jgi:uncharacterized OB-fold protein
MTLEPVERDGHLVLEDRWNLLHRHALGRVGEAFARGVEEGRLVAARCDGCERVLLPPRGFCERCFQETSLVDFPGRAGELLAFTLVRLGFAGSPPAPYAIAYARLDGSDTALGALVESFDGEQADGGLTVGMRVELVIAERGFGMERLRLRRSS